MASEQACVNNGSGLKHSNGHVKREATSCNPVLLEYSSSIRGVLAYLLARVCPEKSMIPIGHGDASSFKCFRTPINVEDAIIESTRSCKYNGYAPSYGLLETRGAVAEYVSSGLPYKLTSNDVYLTVGCSQAIQVCMQVLATKGSNILLPRPGFPVYETACGYNGIEIRFYDLIPENNWEVDLDQVQALADDKTVAMVIITLGGISKRWLIPGWRFGWLVACDPHDILKRGKIQEGVEMLMNITPGPTTIVQAAVPSILRDTSQEFFEQTLHLLETAADICYNRIQKINSLWCHSRPKGSMFIMVKLNISALNDIKDDMEFASALVKEESVVVLPGSTLGMKNWIRISFGAPSATLEEAWDRIESFCQKHSNTI